MIKLYGSNRSRALRNLWCLKELGVDYERDDRDHVSGEIKTDAYLAINPSGKVPSMTDHTGGGDVEMFECLAINLYLAMTYGKGTLWPDGAVSQADCLQWSMFSATEVEPHTVGALMERIFKPEAMRDEAAALKHLEQLPRAFTVLEGVLGKQSYLCGKAFTIADLNVACVAASLHMVQFDFLAFPKVSAWLGACSGRPANQDVVAGNA